MDSSSVSWSNWTKALGVVACVGGFVLIGYLDELINGKPETRKAQRKQPPRTNAEREELIAEYISQETNGRVTNVNEYITGLLRDAKAAQEAGNFEKAEEHYQKGITLAEKVGDEHGQWLFMTFLANALKEKGDYSGAEQCLKKILAAIAQAIHSGQVDPDSVMEQYIEVCTLLSDIYFLTGEYEKAGSLLNEVIGQYERKEEVYKTLPPAALRDPRVLAEVRKLQSSLPIFYQTMSKINVKMGLIPEALKSSKLAIMKILAFPEATPLLNTFVNQYVQIMQDNGSTAEEISDAFDMFATEAEERQSSLYSLVLLYTIFAQFHAEKDDYNSAEFRLKKALELVSTKPDDTKLAKISPAIMNALATTLREIGKHEEAAQIMDQLKQKLSGDALKSTIPPLTNSKFLRTKSAMVDTKGVGPRFSLLYEIKNLKLGSVLETTFPTLQTEGEEVEEVKETQVNHTVEEGKQNIDIQSPVYESIPVGLYEVVTKVFSDETKTDQLSQHHILVSYLGANPLAADIDIAQLVDQLRAEQPGAFGEDGFFNEEESPFGEEDHDFQD